MQTNRSAVETDPLKTGFLKPSAGARPRVWWHWMNGNITPEGLQLDLEWMKRAGLGGFTVFYWGQWRYSLSRITDRFHHYCF
jgi:hypothetical protein